MSKQPANGKFELKPIDIATLIYIAIEIIITLIFAPGISGKLYLTLFYTSSAGIVFLVAVFPVNSDRRFWKFIRVGYPMFLFLFFYRIIGKKIFMIHGKPYDSLIHKFEVWMYGNDVSFLLQRYAEIWLNELMNFGYILYYFLLPLASFLFIMKKKWKSLEYIILSSAITSYFCYLIFILFPVTGPRFYLSEMYYLPLIGPFFTKMAAYLVEAGGHQGAAMPSAHCAVALVAVWISAKSVKWTVIPGVLALVLLCSSTVYGRYHYITDVFVGLFVGAVGMFLGKLWMEKHYDDKGEKNMEIPDETESKVSFF